MEQENVKNAKTLLEHVHLLIKKNDELLDATGARFNMFKVCGVNHYENTHSAIITEFLKPDGSHGMGSLFLEAFLKVLQLDDAFAIKAEKCRVGTEVYTGDGRMDILITDDTYAICIENKVYAGDQQAQLKKYKDYLTKKYPNRWKICYLTLYGHSASENSGDGVGYSKIAYSSDIINWLEECIKISAEKPMLRETLCQYRNHIKKLTGTNMEKKYMDDLVDLISGNAENYSSALEITKMFWQAKNAIFEKFLKELEQFIQKNLGDDEKIEFFSTTSPKKYSAFGFWNPSWKFKIRFEFQDSNYNNLIFGITIKKDFKDKIAHIASKFKDENGEFFNKFEDLGWPLYKNVQKLLWCDDIVEKIMNAEQNKELLDLYKAELTKIIPFVRECIEFQNSNAPQK